MVPAVFCTAWLIARPRFRSTAAIAAEPPLQCLTFVLGEQAFAFTALDAA